MASASTSSASASRLLAAATKKRVLHPSGAINCGRRASSSSARPLDSVPRRPSSGSSSSARRQYGQPLPPSHPHMFPEYDKALPFPGLFPQRELQPQFDYHSSLSGDRGQEQLTPGLTRNEYEKRRRRLMDEVPEGSVVLVMAGRTKFMSGQIFYRFRQASNLFYLTGFTEPDAALVLEKESGSSRRGYKMTLFVSGREELHEAWNGPRTGTDGAVDVFGADDAIEMDSEGRSLLDYLKDVLPDASKIYHDPALAPTIPRKPSRSAGTSVGSSSGSSSLLNYLSPGSPSSFDIFSRKTDFDNVVKLLGDSRRCVDLSSAILDRHRLVKSPSELRLMRRAGHIAGLAHNSTMRFSNMYRGHDAGASEWAMQAHFEYTAALLGASRPAYVPVVAGGERGCTIHYTDNDHLVAGTQEVAGGDGTTGQLVTMDAGIEYAGYNSDITRAWPVASGSAGSSGKISMTSAQLDLYSALLRVLKTCSSLAVAQNGYSLSSLHRRSVELLAAELKDLGFQLSVGELERVFYPHYLGHYLGLDLHDTPSIARTQPLKPGMVVTIEPGLYIPSEDSVMGKSLRSRIPKEYRGIGLRVEDDVAIGERDNVVLSVEAVKEVDDVLKVCQGWEADHSADAVQGGSRSVLGAEVERMLARGPQGTGL